MRGYSIRTDCVDSTKIVLLGKPSKKRIASVLAFGRNHEKVEIDELRAAIDGPVVLDQRCSAGWLTKMLTPEDY